MDMLKCSEMLRTDDLLVATYISNDGSLFCFRVKRHVVTLQNS